MKRLVVYKEIKEKTLIIDVDDIDEEWDVAINELADKYDYADVDFEILSVTSLNNS
jgi:hypothetical protein